MKLFIFWVSLALLCTPGRAQIPERQEFLEIISRQHLQIKDLFGWSKDVFYLSKDLFGSAHDRLRSSKDVISAAQPPSAGAVLTRRQPSVAAPRRPTG